MSLTQKHVCMPLFIPWWTHGGIYVRIKYKGRGNVCQLHNVGQYIATGTPETSMGESLPSVV